MMVTKLTAYSKRHNMLPGSGTVIACVSGGADSMALLAALLEIAPAEGFNVEVAHFDHRLRGAESDHDRDFVVKHCKNLGVKCHVGFGDTLRYASEHKLGIEESARILRYAFFRETANKTGAVRIATAHNADDNAETVLLSLARGSGARGLSGIPPVRGDIIRPLLCISRSEIEAFLNKRGIQYATDSTNLSDVYARNKIRHHVSHVLQSVNPAYLRHVLESGELLRCDDEFLSSLAEEFLDEHGENIPVTLLSALPKPVAARVIIALAGGVLPFSHVESILALCGGSAGTKSVKVPGGIFIREYDILRFQKSPSTASFSPFELLPGTSAEITEAGLIISCVEAIRCDVSDGLYVKRQKFDNTVNKSFNNFVFKKDEICGRIIVRPRQEGDFIRIQGRNVSKSLKKLFIEKKIPKTTRGLIPVIADDAGPLSVYGICRGTRALPEDGSSAIKISFVRVGDA